MRIRRFRSIESECLDRLRGGASIDQCIEMYPKHAERLRPVLSLADKVSRTPRAQLRPGAQERGWHAVQARADELRAGKHPFRIPTLGPSYRTWFKAGGVAAGVLVLFTATGGGLAYASQDALPDSPLYRVKLFTEDVHLLLVFDDSHEAEILLDQSDERMEEILALVGNGKEVPANALSAMQDRNERAADIMRERPEETGLRARVLTQAQDQENLLVALWPEVPEGARNEYASAVAQLHNTRLDGGTGVVFAPVQPEELFGGILSISGQAEQIEEGLWSVGGVEVRIDERTLSRNDIRVGESARFVVARSSNGRLHVLSLSNLGTSGGPTGAIVSGAVEQVTDDGIIVAGNFIAYDDTTLQTGSVRVGQHVQVTLGSSPNGYVADSVRPSGGPGQIKTLTFEGTIVGDVSRSTNFWTIGGLEFEITPSTTFDARAGSAADGARVQVEALNRDGQLEALRVTVLSTTDASDTATIIGTFDGFDDSEGVWIISGIEVVPPETGADPAEGALVIVDTQRDSGIGLVTTGYATVESPDDLALVRFQGTISHIDGTRWNLEFGQVRVASTADVSGEPDVGVRVIVWGERGPDGALQARYVRVLDDVPVLTPTPGAEPAPATQ